MTNVDKLLIDQRWDPVIRELRCIGVPCLGAAWADNCLAVLHIAGEDPSDYVWVGSSGHDGESEPDSDGPWLSFNTPVRWVGGHRYRAGSDVDDGSEALRFSEKDWERIMDGSDEPAVAPVPVAEAIKRLWSRLRVAETPYSQ